MPAFLLCSLSKVDLVQVEESFRGKSYGTRNRDSKLGVPDPTGQVRLRLVGIVGASATAVW